MPNDQLKCSGGVRKFPTTHLGVPYASHGIRSLRNDGDQDQQSGGQTLVTVASTTDGYAATFALGIQMR